MSSRHPRAPTSTPAPLNRSRGNFTWTDAFDSAKLSPLWVMLRTPKETWWHLGDGHLSITPRADLISGMGNPSFLGRRLQHAKFETCAKLAVPATVGTSAGLAVVQNETHHYYCGVRRSTEGLNAFVELQNGPKTETLVSLPLPAGLTDVELRLIGDGASLSFLLCAGGLRLATAPRQSRLLPHQRASRRRRPTFHRRPDRTLRPDRPVIRSPCSRRRRRA